MEIATSPIFQVAVVLVSATLVVASLALIVASRHHSVKRLTDSEACLSLNPDSTEVVVMLSSTSPSSSSSSSSALASKRFQTMAIEPVYLAPSGPYNQQRLIEMLKSKRVSISPEIHSARKFALVNRHILNVFKEHRRYTQLPTFAQAATSSPAYMPAAAAARPWASSVAYSGSVNNRFSASLPLVSVS
jgi:hypothetical protein